MTIVYKFRVWCKTDNKYEVCYGTEPPTKCPFDTSHLIDTYKTVIESETYDNNSKKMTINEYTSNLAGYYKVKGEYMLIPDKHKIVGKTTTAVKMGDKVLDVDNNAINALNLDDYVQLNKNGVISKFGKIIAIDRKNKQITCSPYELEDDDNNLDADADIELVSVTKDFVQPIDIGVLSFCFNSTTKHEGDGLEVQVYPNVKIGAIIKPVNSGDTVFNVTPTVVQNIKRGFYCRLDDGVVSECFGIVTNVDIVNNQITVKKPAINNFSPFGPTFVLMTVKMLEMPDIGPPYANLNGLDKHGGSTILKGVPVRVSYVNFTNTKKRFVFKVGHIY